jgi:hypothetical protein
VNRTFILGERDREILTALTQKVRLFGFRQLAHHYFAGDPANTRRRLRILERAGLIVRAKVIARSIPVLIHPIYKWSPGESVIDMGIVAHRVQSRWRQRPARACQAVLATEHAAQLVGGHAKGQLTRETQATHDLGVAVVWLHLDRTAPDRAKAWCGEDVLAHLRRGEKRPDAFLVTASHEVQSVIEFGGDYDAARLRSFHDDCANRHLPYEVW